MAWSMLFGAVVPTPSSEAIGPAPRDLLTFNRWLCVTRLRAAFACSVFVLGLHHLSPRMVDALPVLGVCLGLGLVSAVGLRASICARWPWVWFYVQSLADLVAITVGIAASLHGPPALLFRPLFAMVIVPSGLISIPGGLAAATVATIGHESLLVLEHGLSTATLLSIESLVPVFLFFLLGQQSFFYGAHLEQKNNEFASLALHLEQNRQRLAAEARMTATLLEVARTLGSTLEAPEILARVNRTTRQQLGADWTATFLVDEERKTFRLAAATDAEMATSELSRVDLPLGSWSALKALATQTAMVLNDTDVERMRGLFPAARPLSTLLVGGLYHDRMLVGFLAIGYRDRPTAHRHRALRLLAGIAQHVAIVLRNARLLEEVREASALKSEWVGAISHELRTPLNAMLGYLEMLIDGALGDVTPPQDDALRRTQQYAFGLLEMITAVLDLNRLEAGRIPVHRTAVSVRALLEEVRQQVPDHWRRAEVDLRLVLPPNLPVIETDKGKLKTVVRNLLHNALKFTDRGHVTLSAERLPTEDLRIVVSDSGRGIPPDAIDSIFEMFHQVPGSGGGGVGLGLHIVRRFVDVLGGRVEVESELGKGTRFTITLPKPKPADVDAPEVDAA
jgi:signal transduction histidine kinase